MSHNLILLLSYQFCNRISKVLTVFFYSIQLDRDCSLLIFVYQPLYIVHTVPTTLYSVQCKMYTSNLSIGIFPFQFHLYNCKRIRKQKKCWRSSYNNVMNRSSISSTQAEGVNGKKKQNGKKYYSCSKRCQHCVVHQLFYCSTVPNCNTCSTDSQSIINWLDTYRKSNNEEEEGEKEKKSNYTQTICKHVRNDIMRQTNIIYFCSPILILFQFAEYMYRSGEVFQMEKKSDFCPSSHNDSQINHWHLFAESNKKKQYD